MQKGISIVANFCTFKRDGNKNNLPPLFPNKTILPYKIVIFLSLNRANYLLCGSSEVAGWTTLCLNCRDRIVKKKKRFLGEKYPNLRHTFFSRTLLNYLT